MCDYESLDSFKRSSFIHAFRDAQLLLYMELFSLI